MLTMHAWKRIGDALSKIAEKCGRTHTVMMPFDRISVRNMPTLPGHVVFEFYLRGNVMASTIVRGQFINDDIIILNGLSGKFEVDIINDL